MVETGTDDNAVPTPMTNFNQRRFDDAREAAEFIVTAHAEGKTLTVDNGERYSTPHMHSNDDYEVAERDDGKVGVAPVDSGIVYPTPEGTFVMHSG